MHHGVNPHPPPKKKIILGLILTSENIRELDKTQMIVLYIYSNLIQIKSDNNVFTDDPYKYLQMNIGNTLSLLCEKYDQSTEVNFWEEC